VGRENAFDGAAFLGLARRAKQDPHRLELLARLLEWDEVVRAVVPVPGATLLVTDRRALEMRPHLEVDGAWNVREFQGYVIAREVSLDVVRTAGRRTGPGDRGRDVDDILHLETTDGDEDFLLSRGPSPILTTDEFDRLASFFLAQAK